MSRLCAMVAVCVLSACAARQGAPQSAVVGDARDRSGFRTLPIGLCEDYPEETRTLKEARRDLEFLREHGVTHLRISFGWDAIEAVDDTFDWSFWDSYIAMAEELGITLMPYLCYTPEWAAREGDEEQPFTTRPPRDVGEFEEFARVASARYADSIATWELWNEPDNAMYWSGSTEEFAELLLAGARGVRAGDPSSRVVLGGIAWNASMLRDLYEVEGVAESVDVVNLHSYFETWSDDPAEAMDGYVGRAADFVARGASPGTPPPPLWMAEVGYSTYRAEGGVVSELYTARRGYEHTEEYAADHLLKTVAMLAALEPVELVAWYELRDLGASGEVIGDVNNRHLGVATERLEPKPALRALVFARELFSESAYRDADLAITADAGSRVQSRAFEREDGAVFCVAWVPTHVPGDRWRDAALGERPPRRRERMTIDAGGFGRAEVLDAKGESLGSRAAGGRVTVEVVEGETVVVVLRR